MKRAGKWLIIICVGVVLLSAVQFRDELLLYLAPKLVLKEALPEVVREAKDRFHGDPLEILGNALEEDGKYTMEGSVVFPGMIGSSVRVTGTLQTDLRKHQAFFQGTIAAPERELELSVYADDIFLAASSGELTQGRYYGITYDSFSEDMRSVPLLELFVNDAAFSRWEDSVRQIQTLMQDLQPIPPGLSEEVEEKLLLGLLALPCKAENRTITVEDHPVKCRCLTYSLSKETLQGMYPIAGKIPERAEISFYLSEDSLERIQCRTAGEGQEFQWSLAPGSASDQIPLILNVSSADLQPLTVTVTTEREPGKLRQNWEFQRPQERSVLQYDWEAVTGDLSLRWNETKLKAVLTSTNQGLYFSAEELDQFLKAAGITMDGLPKSCSVSLRQGSGILVPEYKNLDSWSAEDLLLLVEGIGTWFGLHFD